MKAFIFCMHKVLQLLSGSIADFIGLPYFSGFPWGLKSDALISHDSQPIEICSITARRSSHVLEASIKTPKEILFCKQTSLYITHTK